MELIIMNGNFALSGTIGKKHGNFIVNVFFLILEDSFLKEEERLT